MEEKAERRGRKGRVASGQPRNIFSILSSDLDRKEEEGMKKRRLG